MNFRILINQTMEFHRFRCKFQDCWKRFMSTFFGVRKWGSYVWTFWVWAFSSHHGTIGMWQNHFAWSLVETSDTEGSFRDGWLLQWRLFIGGKFSFSPGFFRWIFGFSRRPELLVSEGSFLQSPSGLPPNLGATWGIGAAGNLICWYSMIFPIDFPTKKVCKNARKTDFVPR